VALDRRRFLTLTGAGAGFALSGSLGALFPANSASARRVDGGYGDLVPDRNGLLDLPRGFRYEVFSREGIDTLDDGSAVPASHDGTAAFAGRRGRTLLVRNHELEPDGVAEEGLPPVPHAPGMIYDHDVVAGGTTTLVVNPARRLESARVSLAGTVDNCAGGPTPWGTWLTCEENFDDLGRRHGYVFEVDPLLGGNPTPITAMGRYEHEAVAFGQTGRAYLTEDAGGESLRHGLVYRFSPMASRLGPGALHQGGLLEAMKVPALVGTDLSVVDTPGSAFDVTWTTIAEPDPDEDEIRFVTDATPVFKAEGVWRGNGAVWFVSSYALGPDAEDPEDITVGVHGGQIWRLDETQQQIELVAQFAAGGPHDGPDNITVSPYGYALACTDGEDDQWLVGINDDGVVFPFGFNRLNDSEFAGATFSPDGRTLYVNIQEPGHTFAIYGPWQAFRGRG
jgi:secreted PhoX family phosphatase